MLGESSQASRIRVTDNDRQAAVERLGRALADGCVTASEFDERVARAWAAVTRGDLAGVIADLPPDRPALARMDERTVSQHPVLQTVTKIWLAVSVISIVLWGLEGLIRADFAPVWCLWVVGPPGAVLSALWYVGDRRSGTS